MSNRRHWGGSFGGGARASIRTPFSPTHGRRELTGKQWDLLRWCCTKTKPVMVRRITFVLVTIRQHSS
jgi:hypothetical protein